MPINPHVNQYNRQLDAIRRREAKLFRVRAPRNAPGGSLMAKIEERIPEKLRGALDTAFYTAFQVLFQQGTGLLKKTIPEKKLRGERYIREYFLKEDPSAEHVRAFHKSGSRGGAAATAAATTARVSITARSVQSSVFIR